MLWEWKIAWCNVGSLWKDAYSELHRIAPLHNGGSACPLGKPAEAESTSPAAPLSLWSQGTFSVCGAFSRSGIALISPAWSLTYTLQYLTILRFLKILCSNYRPQTLWRLTGWMCRSWSWFDSRHQTHHYPPPLIFSSAHQWHACLIPRCYWESLSIQVVPIYNLQLC